MFYNAGILLNCKKLYGTVDLVPVKMFNVISPNSATFRQLAV